MQWQDVPSIKSRLVNLPTIMVATMEQTRLPLQEVSLTQVMEALGGQESRIDTSMMKTSTTESKITTLRWLAMDLRLNLSPPARADAGLSKTTTKLPLTSIPASTPTTTSQATTSRIDTTAKSSIPMQMENSMTTVKITIGKQSTIARQLSRPPDADSKPGRTMMFVNSQINNWTQEGLMTRLLGMEATADTSHLRREATVRSLLGWTLISQLQALLSTQVVVSTLQVHLPGMEITQCKVDQARWHKLLPLSSNSHTTTKTGKKGLMRFTERPRPPKRAKTTKSNIHPKRS